MAPAEARDYDPEINDIASYVHNKPIDSDLAVRCPSVAVDASPLQPKLPRLTRR